MKKIYLMAVALVAFATASFAQGCTYDRQTGTIKIWKPDYRFTVNSGGTQVYFSKGNLQYNSGTQKWQFALHQYDYVGASGNTSITEDGKANGTGVADLFGWVGASSTWTGLKQYGLTSSTTTNSVNGYGNVYPENLKSDWGTVMGSGWRTLTKDEWVYLLNTRAAATVNSVSNIRYAKATINTDGTAVKGIILFPDEEIFASSEFTAVGSPNTPDADYTTTCTSAQWIALEKKGCIFLPASGSRGGTTMHNVGTFGLYWSSSSYSNTNAYYLVFHPSGLNPQGNDARSVGRSVRLVKNVE